MPNEMKISKQNRREAKELFRSCVANGALDEQRVRKAVDEIIAAKPRGYVGIISHFQRLLKLDEARRAAKIESAVPLSPEVQSDFKTSLERQYGKGLNFTFAQNSSLLGGVRVQVGSDVYDGSVQARLNSLEESF